MSTSFSSVRRFGPTLPRPIAAKWDQSPRRNRSLRGNTIREIARLAGANDGVVARREILAAGIEGHVIDRHLARGDLVPIYRSVFAIGHAELPEIGRWRAALLLVGEGACLSHSSAAKIHRLLDDARFSEPGLIHVTRRGGGRSGIRHALAPTQPPVRIHRAKGLGPENVCWRRGLAVTTVERTLVDLASMLTRRQLEGAVLRAQRLNVLDVPTLTEWLREARFGQTGVGVLRDLIGSAVPAKARTLSDPEAWMLDLFRKWRLPEPLVNVPIEEIPGIRVDFLWPKAKVIVEFDGHAFHSSREALRRDKRRDRALQLAGYRVLRYTYEDLINASDEVAAEIAEALRRS